MPWAWRLKIKKHIEILRLDSTHAPLIGHIEARFHEEKTDRLSW